MGTFFRAKIDCRAPPAAADFRLRGSYQKIKNGLRIICYAPHSSKALLCPPSPRGEGYIKGINFNFKRYVAVRYETGDARPPGGRLYQRHKFSFQTVCSSPLRNGQCPPPQGEAFIIGINFNFKRFVAVRYETGDARPPGGRLYQRQLENKLRPSSPPLRGRASPRGEALKRGFYLEFKGFISSDNFLKSIIKYRLHCRQERRYRISLRNQLAKSFSII